MRDILFVIAPFLVAGYLTWIERLGVAAFLVGTSGLGALLLAWSRVQPILVTFDAPHAAHGVDTWSFPYAGVFAAVLVAGLRRFGFSRLATSLVAGIVALTVASAGCWIE